MIAVTGFYGKLPARGDFVWLGLPRGFVDPWDAWWQRGISATREAAADWTAAWLEAPVWRFSLPPGLCGDGAALGLWLPSVDRAGRYFPLTIAAVGDPGLLTDDAAGGFLAEAEQAGLDALEHDLNPDALCRRIAAAFGAGSAAPSRDLRLDVATWWTDGGTRVAATTIATSALPEGAVFAAMLDNAWGTLEAYS